MVEAVVDDRVDFLPLVALFLLLVWMHEKEREQKNQGKEKRIDFYLEWL